MIRKVSHGSAGDYQADEQAGVARLSCRLSTDEQAGVTRLSWRQSSRRAGRCRAAQLAYIKQMRRQVSCGSYGDNHADEQEGVLRLSGDYQADEQACVTRLIWPQSIRRAGRCPAAQLSIIKQMSRQVSRGSAGDYQADEQAGVARLSWRLSSRWAGRCRAAQLSIIKQMNRQVSWGSDGHSQADEQAGVALLSWRLSSR